MDRALLGQDEEGSVAWLQRVERSLGAVLSRAQSVDEALAASLDAVLAVPGIDSCGIFLVDDNGSLVLATHRGINDDAARRGGKFDADGAQARIVNAGVPIYADGTIAWLEGEMVASAIIPIFATGEAVGCLHVGSGAQFVIGPLARGELENIASWLGATVARIRAEEARLESEVSYRFLTENIKDVIWSMDMETLQFLYVSPSVTALRGFTPEEVMAQPIDAAVPPEVAVRIRGMIRDRLACFEAGERVDGQRLFFTEEVPQPCKNGSMVWTEVVTSFWRNPKSGRIEIHGVTRDITARRAADAEKRNLQEQLSQSGKLEAIGRLAGGIAHDFNNMLTVILSEAEMALMPESSDDPPERAFESIRQAAKRSAELTRQLLAFARKQSVVPRVLALNQLITLALGMLRRLLGENIRLDWTPGNDIRPVRVDPTQIDQILVNLCVNARDAIAGTGVLTIKTIMVTLDQSHSDELPDSYPGEFVVLVVSDTGQGMTKEVREHIFEPFFTTKTRGHGTGLGLATVYGIARQNGGFISVHSHLGQGSSFRVYFPASSGVAAADNRAKEQVEVSGKGNVVLLVEDETSVLQVSRMLLERLGFTVLATCTPREALQLAGEYSGDIHMLVTDVVMPEMSGKDLYARLCQSRPWLKCLYVSGYADGLGDGAGILDEGVVLLEKPYTLRSLADKLQEATISNKWRARRERS